MKLTGLVSYFRNGGTFEGFCEEQSLDVDSEVIEVYARTPVSLDSELGFFPVEETGGRAELQLEGLLYQNLFDFFYFLDVIEDVKKAPDQGDDELARRLLSYALKDA